MKRFLIPAALCCALVACGGANANNASDGSASGTAAAGASQNASEAMPEKEADPYTMPDGKLFELKGNVRKCTIAEYCSDSSGNPSSDKPESEVSIEFDAAGKISRHSDYEKFVRGSGGALEKMTWYCSEFGFDFEDQLTVSASGFVVKEKIVNLGGNEWVYELDESSERVKAVSASTFEEGIEGKSESTYKILERDPAGNWTKRLAEVREGQREMGGGDFQWSSFHKVQIRKIEY